MDKELIDKAWACLPREFREEVKKLAQYYSRHVSALFGMERQRADKFYREFVSLFGHHNLTSDAEGEAMLMCDKSKVQEAYKTSKDIVNNEQYGTRQYSIHTQIMCVLENLFGSKCLPDELNEDNFAKSEPKFKYGIGQKVKSVCADEVLTIKEHCGRVGNDNVYKVEEYAYTWNECELRPYTEPAEPTCTRTCTDDCPSQTVNLSKETANCDKCNGLRLHIAAMAMQGILGNADRMKSYERIAMSEPYEDLPAVVARNAVRYANALIAECSKDTTAG